MILCIGQWEQDCTENDQLGQTPSSYLSKDKVGHISLLHIIYKMAEVEGLAEQNLEYEKTKEFFEDRDSEIFDTILLNGPI